MTAQAQHSADLWELSDDELARLTPPLRREPGRGQIRTDAGGRVCAYSGREHQLYLRKWYHRVPGGYVVVWIDQDEWNKIRPRKKELLRLLGKLAEKLAGKVIP